MCTWNVVWDECSEESTLSESSVVMSVVYSKRIECWKELNWEELKSVQGTKCSIWDIVRRKKSKQVPSWDPRQHVECWGPFTEIKSSRLDFQLSTPRDLVRWMGWTRHENRVQWTRFPCMENEFFELGKPKHIFTKYIKASAQTTGQW